MKSIVKLKQQIESERIRAREAIGNKLKFFRMKNNMTQQEVCEAIGIERTSVTNIEAGRNNMTIEQLLGFCEVFNITPNDMLDEIYITSDDAEEHF